MKKKIAPESAQQRYDRLFKEWVKYSRIAERLKVEWQAAADQVRYENEQRDKQTATAKPGENQ